MTDSKAAKEGTIVAFDLWVTGLPVAPAPHWRAHGARRAGRACMDQTGGAGARLCGWASIYWKMPQKLYGFTFFYDKFFQDFTLVGSRRQIPISVKL